MADLNTNQLATAFDLYEQRLDSIHNRLKQTYEIHRNYSALYKRLLSLQNKLRHDTLIPFGSQAFIPGQIVNTNAFIVHIGDKYHSEMQYKQAVELIERRLSNIQQDITSQQNEMRSVAAQLAHIQEIFGKQSYESTFTDRVAANMIGQSEHTQSIDAGGNNGSVQTVSHCVPTTESRAPVRAELKSCGKNEDGEDIIDIVEFYDNEESAEIGHQQSSSSSSQQQQQQQPSNRVMLELEQSAAASSTSDVGSAFYKYLLGGIHEMESQRQDEQDARYNGFQSNLDAVFSGSNDGLVSDADGIGVSFGTTQRRRGGGLIQMLDDDDDDDNDDNASSNDGNITPQRPTVQFNPTPTVVSIDSTQDEQHSNRQHIDSGDDTDDATLPSTQALTIADLLAESLESGQNQPNEGEFHRFWNYLDQIESRVTASAAASAAGSAGSASASAGSASASASAATEDSKQSQSDDKQQTHTVDNDKQQQHTQAQDMQTQTTKSSLSETNPKQSKPSRKEEPITFMDPQIKPRTKPAKQPKQQQQPKQEQQSAARSTPTATTTTSAGKPIIEEHTPSAADVYQQYLLSIGNNTTTDFFAQYLDTFEEDDADMYYDDEDGNEGDDADLYTSIYNDYIVKANAEEEEQKQRQSADAATPKYTSFNIGTTFEGHHVLLTEEESVLQKQTLAESKQQMLIPEDESHNNDEQVSSASSPSVTTTTTTTQDTTTTATTAQSAPPKKMSRFKAQRLGLLDE